MAMILVVVEIMGAISVVAILVVVTLVEVLRSAIEIVNRNSRFFFRRFRWRW